MTQFPRSFLCPRGGYGLGLALVLAFAGAVLGTAVPGEIVAAQEPNPCALLTKDEVQMLAPKDQNAAWPISGKAALAVSGTTDDRRPCLIDSVLIPANTRDAGLTNTPSA